MKNVTKNADWEERENRQARAAFLADTIIGRLALPAPIDPFSVIESETPLILVEGGDFRNAYDGKLKYGSSD